MFAVALGVFYIYERNFSKENRVVFFSVSKLPFLAFLLPFESFNEVELLESILVFLIVFYLTRRKNN